MKKKKKKIGTSDELVLQHLRPLRLVPILLEKQGHTGARCYSPAAGLCRCTVLPSSYVYPVTPALYSPPVCREAHSHAGKTSMVSQIMDYLNGRQKYISQRDTLSESDPTQTHPRTLQLQSLIIRASSIPSASTVPTPQVL